jgi:hypothetical protein
MAANLPKRPHKTFLFSLLGCSLLLATSCASLGSRAIKGERINFNAALQQTADEQLLLNLVRLRYRDTPAFLEGPAEEFNPATSPGPFQFLFESWSNAFQNCPRNKRSLLIVGVLTASLRSRRLKSYVRRGSVHFDWKTGFRIGVLTGSP